MTDDNARRTALQQLIQDDAVGQLRRRDGLMAKLGSEDGVLKLDWVEGVARLLAEPLQLEQVEAEARGIVVFDDQTLNASAPGYHQDGLLRVRVVTEVTQAGEEQLFLLAQPSLASAEAMT